MPPLFEDVDSMTVTNADIEHYVKEAHRMRSMMLRDMFVGLARYVRVGIERGKDHAGNAISATAPAKIASHD